jgi:peptidyl-prolyl cis-trans isomerase A (cyclophilin A)
MISDSLHKAIFPAKKDQPVEHSGIVLVGFLSPCLIPLERTRDTGLRHRDGALSMARNGADTAQSSFSICVGEQPELDFGGKRNPDGQGFATFGHVIEGMDVVRKIHESPSNGQRLTPPLRIMRIVRIR